MKLITIFFLLFSIVLVTFSQSYKNMYLKCDTMEITMSIPSIFKDTILNYEEGYDKILFEKDGSNIIFHCGSLAQPTCINSINSTTIYSSYEKIKKSVIGIDTITKKFWRVDYYNNRRLTISFENIPLNKIKLYNTILDNIKSK